MRPNVIPKKLKILLENSCILFFVQCQVLSKFRADGMRGEKMNDTLNNISLGVQVNRLFAVLQVFILELPTP